MFYLILYYFVFVLGCVLEFSLSRCSYFSFSGVFWPFFFFSFPIILFPSFSPDLYQTLIVLIFVCPPRVFVPAVIPMWKPVFSSWFSTQWKCDVYMYRFLQFFLLLILFPPQHHPLYPAPLLTHSVLIWLFLLPNTLKGNGTASKQIFHFSLSSKGCCYMLNFICLSFFTS